MLPSPGTLLQKKKGGKNQLRGVSVDDSAWTKRTDPKISSLPLISYSSK